MRRTFTFVLLALAIMCFAMPVFAADGGAALQEDFHQPNDPRFRDFDSGITDGADGHRQRQPLQTGAAQQRRRRGGGAAERAAGLRDQRQGRAPERRQAR